MDQCRDEGREKRGSRILRVWVPVASAIGASAALIASAFRTRPGPAGGSAGKNDLNILARPSPVKIPPPPTALVRKYVQVGSLGGKGSGKGQFRDSLLGIATGPGDQIYALGDGEVKVFEPDGALLRSWKAPGKAICLAAGANGRVYTGRPGRVDIFNAGGKQTGGFSVGAAEKPAAITAIQVRGEEVLVADASACFVRRFDPTGRSLGEVGAKTKTGGCLLPNGRMDLAVDSMGVVRTTDPGRHRVSAWSLEGESLGYFGKFGHKLPEDFVGCCNPINLAITPDGKVVTAEKVIPRVKVFEPEGALLGYIGPEHFDPYCTFLDLAVDSRGRILVADPVRLNIQIFSQSKEPERS